MVVMRPPRVRGLFLAGAFAVAAASSSGLARAEEPRARVARAPVPLDGVAAIVDDVTIFRSDVASRLRHFESKLSRDPRERRIQLVELSKEILTRIVNETLFFTNGYALVGTVTMKVLVRTQSITAKLTSSKRLTKA